VEVLQLHNKVNRWFLLFLGEEQLEGTMPGLSLLLTAAIAVASAVCDDWNQLQHGLLNVGLI
jgi:hypothetical protein